MSKNIYFESRGEPEAGQQAVADVTLNRVNDKRFPDTVCKVVYQKYKGICQFSWCNRGYKIHDLEAWNKSMEISYNLLTGQIKNNMIGVLYFHVKKMKKPSWAYQMKRYAVIGSHIFYVDPKVEQPISIEALEHPSDMETPLTDEEKRILDILNDRTENKERGSDSILGNSPETT